MALLLVPAEPGTAGVESVVRDAVADMHSLVRSAGIVAGPSLGSGSESVAKCIAVVDAASDGSPVSLDTGYVTLAAIAPAAMEAVAHISNQVVPPGCPARAEILDSCPRLAALSGAGSSELSVARATALHDICHQVAENDPHRCVSGGDHGCWPGVSSDLPDTSHCVARAAAAVKVAHSTLLDQRCL